MKFNEILFTSPQIFCPNLKVKFSHLYSMAVDTIFFHVFLYFSGSSWKIKPFPFFICTSWQFLKLRGFFLHFLTVQVLHENLTNSISYLYFMTVSKANIFFPFPPLFLLFFSLGFCKTARRPSSKQVKQPIRSLDTNKPSPNIQQVTNHKWCTMRQYPLCPVCNASHAEMDIFMSSNKSML